MKLMLGLWLVATFRQSGFAEFPGTRQAFLNSFAPLLAFPLVGAALGLLQGAGLAAFGGFLGTVVALLTPAVVSHALARAWDSEQKWLRYAAVFNWCQWAVPLAAVPLLVMAGTLARLGVPTPVAAIAMLVALLVYGLSLHFFLARHGLGLTRGRAVLMVLATNLATGVLVFVPRFLVSGWAMPVP